MNLMRYAEMQERSFCISWMDDGVSFIIRDTDELVGSVVPMFFKGESKFVSFKRKLHRWGFQVVLSVKNRLAGRDDKSNMIIAFRNDNFQRDRPELMQHMQSATGRSQQQNPGNKANSHPVADEACPKIGSSMVQQPPAPATTSSASNLISFDPNNTMYNMYNMSNLEPNPINLQILHLFDMGQSNDSHNP
jgi:hypothetical protein